MSSSWLDLNEPSSRFRRLIVSVQRVGIFFRAALKAAFKKVGEEFGAMDQGVNVHRLQEWVGKSELHSDRIMPVPIAALSATLDREDPFPREGDALPPLWHWLYFLPLHRQSEMNSDGHARRGDFLPPVPLPHRMFAGGRVQWHHPLRVGEVITRNSRILDVTYKEGRSGQLVFVTAYHEVGSGGGLALAEELDIVYRDKTRRGELNLVLQSAPENADWSRTIQPDEVLMFRFSALTFNSHRIHYDRRYATEVEGYPGLVVHGPLVAILLLDLLTRNLPEMNLTKFSFRAVKPIFDIEHFVVCGRLERDRKTCKLWAADLQGNLAMDAAATLT
jgi:3-methylfumaryl-CoA hydratase